MKYGGNPLAKPKMPKPRERAQAFFDHEKPEDDGHGRQSVMRIDCKRCLRERGSVVEEVTVTCEPLESFQKVEVHC